MKNLTAASVLSTGLAALFFCSMLVLVCGSAFLPPESLAKLIAMILGTLGVIAAVNTTSNDAFRYRLIKSISKKFDIPEI